MVGGSHLLRKEIAMKRKKSPPLFVDISFADLAKALKDAHIEQMSRNLRSHGMRKERLKKLLDHSHRSYRETK